MQLLKIEQSGDATYPYSVAQMKSENPNVSFPKNLDNVDLTSFGVYKVIEESVPLYDENTQLLEREPVPTQDAEGNWTIGWVVIDIPAEQLMASKMNLVEQAVQKHINMTAQTYGYDNINSIAKYMGYANSYRAEAEALGAWCASCWDKCYSILDEVQGGVIPEPTIEELIAMLPGYGV